MTGELSRAFLKHKIYGTVFAVERDEDHEVLAATVITEATACRHRLSEYNLSLDDASEINRHERDYELFEPACSDPTHLLSEIGAAEKSCQLAEAEWVQAHSRAKALKEIFEEMQDKLRSVVREATAPKPLPLFDKPAA